MQLGSKGTLEVCLEMMNCTRVKLTVILHDNKLSTLTLHYNCLLQVVGKLEQHLDCVLSALISDCQFVYECFLFFSFGRKFLPIQI